MVGNLQPLDQKFAIVDANGNPTTYFTKWAQQKQLDIGSAITLADLEAFLTAHKLREGSGIQFTPDGDLNNSPLIAADVQEILDQITSTRGAILFRGVGGWAPLVPGTAGNALLTHGAGLDPTWGAVTAAAAWGSITGTLSAQTDLQTALNGKASTALFTSTTNGLTPASGGGTANFLRADSSWAVPPGTTYAVFTSVANGLAPLSGGGTVNFLRADGSWAVPPGSTAVFTAVANGLAPLSGGGTVNFLRADGTWAPAGVSTVFTSVANGLAPASGGGTSNFLRADGNWAIPAGTATNSIFPINPPPFGSFTWVNQGTSTFTVNADGSVTLIPQDLGSDQIRAVMLPIPTTPWTRTIGFIPTIPSTGFGYCGIALRESSSGKMVILGCYRDASATALWISMNYNSATSKNANVVVPATPSNWTHAHPIYATVSDDGVTRKCSLGVDPHYTPFLNYSVAHNSFIVPDQIGLFFDANGNGGGGITCFSWQ